MGSFDGKVAMITGAGRGQGRAHAIALAEQGADIVAIDIDHQITNVPYSMTSPGDLDETRAQVEKFDRRCVTKIADVRDFAAIDVAATSAISELGQIDILVANAGAYIGGPIADTAVEDWTTVIDINLNGVFNAIRAVAPHMIERQYGRIIATASGMGRHGAENLASYAASKWGIIGLVKSAAKELGRHSITVNAINPGMVDTLIVKNDYLRGLYNPELENPTDEDVAKKVYQGNLHYIPDVPFIPVEDIAKAVVYLASDDARYVSGGTIDVGAGYAANHM
ncbi:mycofactocin-coupled SDR family oxidoreductase [Rhodococcus sp. ACPA1]|uniref:mycofactocin-coupled SDR family oxidoreductase n=1 Tax=Rhodococcus sp. ACPA1 TaxID=2028572 RepID=UPI000BB11C32|nr:mycofactocin-coupled SDR family oxidoreductase [Rhodococcus sp. ACPA1]PBC47169.1 SDR family mycofactocin-dependent oxidoreductase [Rhodococcus sp. ACPA1]